MVLVAGSICFLVLAHLTTTGLQALSSERPLSLSLNFPDQLTFDLMDSSAWSWLVGLIFLSGIGLWLYSAYLEFDPSFCSFALKLVLFLFSVWLLISCRTMALALLGWEAVGFISFSLIGTWISRSFTAASSFSAIGFNRIGDVVLAVLLSSGLFWA